MKKLFARILTFALIFTLAACGNDKPTPSDKTEVKWLVASEEYIYEDAIMGTVNSTFTYDDFGNVLTVLQKTPTGDINITYKYNDQHQCIGMDTAQGGLTIQYKFTLDKKGNRVKTELCNGTQVIQTTKATFDKDGNMLTQEVEGNSFQSKTEYTYDENGNMLSSTYYLSGALSNVTKVEYDDQGRQIQATTTDATGALIGQTKVTFDGNTETQTATDADGKVTSTTVITRDENGNIVKKAVSGSATSPYTYTATYISKEVPVSE